MKNAHDDWSKQELDIFLTIENPNSCGQGFNPHHVSNPHHDMLTELGLEYSHTTPIRAVDGSKFAHHTYIIPDTDWRIGVNCRPGFIIESGRGGSGRYHRMFHDEAKRYLKRKLRELKKK